MKKTFCLLALMFSYFALAQTPILSRHDADYGKIDGAYYKDIGNDFNEFEGTWEYANGNDILTVVLVKKEMQPAYIGNTNYYEDIVVGEYRYVQNGVEKINTLANLQINYADPYSHNLVGGILTKYNPNIPAACIGCGPNEMKMRLSFTDPEIEICGAVPTFFFRNFEENGVKKLYLTFRNMGHRSYDINNPSACPHDEYNVPFGDYVLVKQ